MKIILEKSKNTLSSTQGTDYFFVVDLSGSMGGAISHLKETLKSTKDLITDIDTISIGYFSSHNDFDWFIKGASLTNHSLDDLIKSKIKAKALTCYDQILDSLPRTIEDVRLLSKNTVRALYFLSDGWPNDKSTDASVISVCKKLRGLFDDVRVMGYSSYYNRNLLLEMAKTMGGQFSHISNHIELEKTYTSSMKTKKTVEKIKLDEKFDLLWQVSKGDVAIYTQNADNSVDLLASNDSGMLFGINFDELDTLTELSDPKFVYSLAMVLSKAGKPNLGVKVLHKAGIPVYAKLLQKAFTVAQKGRVENELSSLALTAQEIQRDTDECPTVLLKDWLNDVEKQLGDVRLNLSKCTYSSITKKTKDISPVKFKKSIDAPKIIKIVGNENRPSINFLTVQQGEIVEVTDDTLKQKIDAFNAVSNKQITFPIATETYKNYNIVSNGDFSFSYMSMIWKNGDETNFPTDADLELFDPNTKEIHINDFVNLNKNLIYEKAHVSVLNWYIKANTTQKHMRDLRVDVYGVDGAKILEEMGLDYEMRYSAKKEKTERLPDADYIPMLEIDTYIKGCSKVSASESRKKFDAAGKQNAMDAVIWPLFQKYDQMKKTLTNDLFVKSLQTTLKGLDQTVKVLSQELASQKFYLVSTNSWFTGIDKSDSFEHDGLVVNVKYTKEYI